MDETLAAAIHGGATGILFGVLYVLLQCCKGRNSKCSSVCFDFELSNQRVLHEIHRSVTQRGDQPDFV